MALQIKDISFRYGTNLILDKISFEQKTGRILALLGPNGTGKTTLLKSLEAESFSLLKEAVFLMEKIF